MIVSCVFIDLHMFKATKAQTLDETGKPPPKVYFGDRLFVRHYLSHATGQWFYIQLDVGSDPK